MKKVAYEEYAVDFGGAKKAEMVERAGGRMTVPQIFIEWPPYRRLRRADGA